MCVQISGMWASVTLVPAILSLPSKCETWTRPRPVYTPTFSLGKLCCTSRHILSIHGQHPRPSYQAEQKGGMIQVSRSEAISQMSLSHSQLLLAEGAPGGWECKGQVESHLCCVPTVHYCTDACLCLDFPSGQQKWCPAQCIPKAVSPIAWIPMRPLLPLVSRCILLWRRFLKTSGWEESV